MGIEKFRADSAPPRILRDGVSKCWRAISKEVLCPLIRAKCIWENEESLYGVGRGGGSSR
jgi:hypothetical protein